MKLKSTAFSEGQEIPKKYTCQGENINPPLEISDVPPGTVTLALIMDDPDVPPEIRKERIYDHWVVYNIEPKTTKIAENSSELAFQGKNTAGQRKYTGPCPPYGRHRYFFKLYALDIKIDTAETKKELEEQMKDHILAECQLMGTYEKS